MTLDEFITADREQRRSRDAGKTLAWQAAWIRSQVEQNGFYSVPIEAFARKGESIAVILHGLPVPPGHTFCPTFHNHNYFELMYVYRGHCVNCFPGEEITLSEGDLLLLNPNILHDPYTNHEDDVLANIMLSKELFEHSLMPLLMDNHLFTNFFSNYFYQVNQTQDYLLFPAAQIPHAIGIVRGILEEYINQSACYQHVIQSSLVILFALLTRSYSERHDICAEMGDKAMMIANVLSYINQHCTDVSLKQLEAEFSYSAGYLSKLIQKHTGKTFSELVHHFRLEKIRSALETSRRPIPELVQVSGFNDLSYLNKVFKKRYGVTPAQYRRSFQEQAE